MTANVVSVVRPQELVESQLSAWRDFQGADERLANPFLAPEFTLAVGRARSNARVAVIESGGTLAGFFPYERGALGVGRAMGSGLADCQAVVHSPDLRPEAQDLTAGCGLAALEFDHLLAYQVPLVAYHVVTEASPIVDLAAGFERYIAGHASLDRQTRRSKRVAERELGPLSFELDVRDKAALRLLIEWKSAQYRRTGRFDRFAKRSIMQIVEEMMESQADGCTGTLSMLYAGGVPVAGHFGLRSKTVLCSWFPAFDARYSRYRPGLLLFRSLIESSASIGIGHIDLGKGQEPYKQELKNGDIAVAEGWVERPVPAALLRRVQRAPRRLLLDFVLSRPALYVRTMG
ncbi:MAG: GNAT family N-acetyltransferase [Chloroflexi bacterium]|nr:MAG: GNAT family N-acetyltransferase [Chloroflexota bacterium]